jgi:hypothetical protein
MNNFLIAISLTVLMSCHSTKKITENNTTNSTQTNEGIYRFNVSFISIGSGTDGKARQQFLDFIKEYETKYSVKIVYEVANWGREGETDYCLKLSELKTDAQNKFIADSKELLKNSKLVRYAENTTCKNKRN